MNGMLFVCCQIMCACVYVCECMKMKNHFDQREKRNILQCVQLILLFYFSAAIFLNSVWFMLFSVVRSEISRVTHVAFAQVIFMFS